MRQQRRSNRNQQRVVPGAPQPLAPAARGKPAGRHQKEKDLFVRAAGQGACDLLDGRPSIPAIVRATATSALVGRTGFGKLGPRRTRLDRFWVLHASAHTIADVKPPNAPPAPGFMFCHSREDRPVKLFWPMGRRHLAPRRELEVGSDQLEQPHVAAAGSRDADGLHLLGSDYIAWRSAHGRYGRWGEELRCRSC